jgi:hypothetical protein
VFIVLACPSVMGHDGAKLRKERRRTCAIGQRGECPKDILLLDRQTRADRVRIDPDSFEFSQQMCESFRL